VDLDAAAELLGAFLKGRAKKNVAKLPATAMESDGYILRTASEYLDD